MNPSLERKLQALVDKDEIRDVMYRYCHAVDRCDRELLRSCYWPDARDHHGFFVGNAHAFVDYVIPVLERALSTTHQLGNVLIEVDGDRASAESYVHVTHRLARADGTLVDNKSNCRYVDSFERRGGEWKILFRGAVMDTMYDEPVAVNADFSAFAGAPVLPLAGARGSADPSCLRFDVAKSDGPDFAMADFWKAILPG
jgi:ketosteroid isomerase-like protein